MNMNKGLFVVVEGRDGVGKTVMANVIGEYLSKTLEVSMQITKEPGSWEVPWNVTIREMIFDKDIDNVSAGILFFIDHYRHAEWVRKKIEEGVSVISDRWLYSQFAYQAVKEERQIDANFLYRKYEKIQIKPDLLFILDCSGEVTKERLQGRTGKDVSQEDKAWGDHERNDAILREEYRKLYNEDKEEQKGVFWVSQDAVGSPKEFFEESIRPEIDRLVASKLKKRSIIQKLTLVKAASTDGESSWIPMPTEVELRNGNVLCDMAAGPCACKVYHNVDETIERIEKLEK